MNRNSVDQEDKRILGQYVEQIVADRFENRSAIVGIERRKYKFIGSYDCDLITVELSTGEQFKIFLKDYRYSQQSKDEPEYRRERELKVYRDLLTRTDLGTPEYYGSIWDHSQKRYWILLEFVDGEIIKDQNVEYGILAAEWLGKMQGFFIKNPEILSSCTFLIHHDSEFFVNKTALAMWNVNQISPPSASRLIKTFKGYKRVIRILETQPLTLVHGGFIPWHILLDFKYKPFRVCAVDWEMAGLGSPLYDLAYFTDGMVQDDCDRVVEAYRLAAIQHDVPVPEKTHLIFIMNVFRLHRIYDWLSRSLEKRYTKHKVEKLVALAEQLSLVMQD